MKRIVQDSVVTKETDLEGRKSTDVLKMSKKFKEKFIWKRYFKRK